MAVTNQQVIDFLLANPGISDADIFEAMKTYGVPPSQMAAIAVVPEGDILARLSPFLPREKAVLLGDTWVQGNYAYMQSGEDNQLGPIESINTYKTTGGLYDKVTEGTDVQNYSPTGEFIQTTKMGKDLSFFGGIQRALKDPYVLGALALATAGATGLLSGAGTAASTAAGTTAGTVAGTAAGTAAGTGLGTSLGTGLTAGAGGLGLSTTGAGLGALGTGAGITAGTGLGTGVLAGSTLGTTLLGTGAGALTGAGILSGSGLGTTLAGTGTGVTAGTGLTTGTGLGSTVTGMGTGTGLTAGTSGLGLNAAGTSGLGALGTGAGITAGTGLGTGVLTGSTLGTGLLGTTAGLAGLTGTGILAGSGLGTSLLGTTGTGALTGTGILTGSNLGTSLLGTGTGTAATVGGLGNTVANLGTGALTTGLEGLSTGLTGLGTGLTSGLSGLGSGLSGLGTSLASGLSGLGSGIGTGLSNAALAQLLSTGLTTGAGLLQQQTSREAAQAALQIINAETAAAKQGAQFRPIGMTTRFGTSQFVTDPTTGRLTSAGFTLTPEAKNAQDRLVKLAESGLVQAEGAQAKFLPLQTGAESLFKLGAGYLAEKPETVAENYLKSQLALLKPGRDLELANIETRLRNQGRLGLSVAQGGNLGAASPELQALYNARVQQEAQLAANAQQYGQQNVLFGAGLLGQGASAMGQYYGGQQQAYSPFTTALGQVQGLEQLAQQPLQMGINLGQIGAQTGFDAGRLGLQGAGQATTLATGPAATNNPYATLLGGLGASPTFGAAGVNALGRLFG